MTGGRFLLLFMGADDAGLAGWARIIDGVSVERGGGEVPLPALDVAERVVLIVPGVDLALHWVDLPTLAAAQAQAAARLLAAEVSATPIDRLHVALGVSEGGLRCMAVADAALVERWIAAAQASGFDPDHILPEPLLLSPPETGSRLWRHEGIAVVRGRETAFAAEPDLAALLAAAPITEVDDAFVEADMAAVLTAMPVDLRQGAFGKRRRWRIDLALARRLALLAGLIVAATLLIQAVLIARYTIDTGRLDREIESVARTALPRGQRVSDAPVQLAERLASLRGGGIGFAPTAALLFAAVRDTANVELSRLLFDRDGSARLTVSAASDADLTAFLRRIESLGLHVHAGAPRPGGGRQMADLVVTAR